MLRKKMYSVLMPLKIVVIMCAICTAHVPSFAFAGESDWEDICRQAQDTQLPDRDRPSVATIRSLKNCTSMDLYYGFDTPPDPVKARLCAYIEMDEGDSQVFGGAAILMMIYANGKGVKRNLDAAIKLACGVGMASAELSGRVEHLDGLRRQKWQGSDFSLCDDITSGAMQGFCSSLELRFDEAKRKKRIAALTAKWSGKDKESLAVLNTAFEGFVKARVNNEVNLSGTGRNAFMIEEEMLLHKDFQEMLEALEQGKLPHYSQEDFSKADRELNIAYQQLQKMDNPPWGTVTNAGIKQTQRTWLTYRDAWVVYGLHKYPGSHAECWKTWLTLKRVKMLKGFVDS